MVARGRLAVGVIAGALVLRLVYGPPRLGYDAWFALSWGRELAHGQLPGFGVTSAPTPHPLANALSALLSVFGAGGATAIAALSLLSLAALGVAVFCLTRSLFGAPAGALVVIVVLTRPLLVDETLFCSVDVPFLALVAAAGAVLAGERRDHRAALALLAVSGLLRPDGWLLTAALAIWCSRRAERPSRRVLVLAVVAAPALWAAFDLLVTGDPLHSFHGTRDLAARFDRPHGAGHAVTAIPDYVQAVLGDQVAWAGAISALAALWLALERAALPLAIAALGLSAFLVLGLADLPLLYRYALLPGISLVVLIGFGAFAWTAAGAPRVLLLALAATTAGLLAASIPPDRDGLDAVRAASRTTETAQQDLERLTSGAAVRSAARRCRRVAAPGPRVVPELAYRLGLRVRAVAVPHGAVPPRAIAFQPATSAIAGAYKLTASDPAALTARQLAGRHIIARTPSWLAYGCL